MNDINVIVETVCNGMYHIETAKIYEGEFHLSRAGLIVRAIETVSYDNTQIERFETPKRKLQEALKSISYNIAHRVIHLHNQYNFDSRDDDVEHFICQLLAMESLFWLKGHWNECPLSKIRPVLVTDKDLETLFPCEVPGTPYHMHCLYNAERDLQALLSYRQYMQSESILDDKRYIADYPESDCIKALCHEFS